MSDLLDAEAQEATQSRVVSSRALGHSSLSLSLSRPPVCVREYAPTVLLSRTRHAGGARERGASTQAQPPDRRRRPRPEKPRLSFLSFSFFRKKTRRGAASATRATDVPCRESALSTRRSFPLPEEKVFSSSSWAFPRGLKTQGSPSHAKNAACTSASSLEMLDRLPSRRRVSSVFLFFIPQRKKETISRSLALSLSLSLSFRVVSRARAPRNFFRRCVRTERAQRCSLRHSTDRKYLFWAVPAHAPLPRPRRPRPR